MLVPNALDLQEFSALPPRGAFRARWGIPRESKVVLFLGRLHSIKGIDFLVQAFAGLRIEGSDALLVIAGADDGELANLRLLVRRLSLNGQVIFTGPLYGEDRLGAYVDADVVASPGAYEIFGLVPFEALMCGTPVIVGQGSGASQLIAHAGAGYVVPYGDIPSLRDTLLTVLGDPSDAQIGVRAGRAFVRRELDWAAIAGRLEGLYASVGGRGG